MVHEVRWAVPERHGLEMCNERNREPGSMTQSGYKEGAGKTTIRIPWTVNVPVHVCAVHAHVCVCVCA